MRADTREGNDTREVLVSTLLGGEIGLMSRPASPIARPGILLDRDGTIIVDHGHVGSVDRVEFIPGSAEAIARFNRAGIPVAVVTNQAGVARGFYGIDDVARVHRYIGVYLAERGAHIDMFVYCPYHPAGTVDAFARTSEDCKPPGLQTGIYQPQPVRVLNSFTGPFRCPRRRVF